MSNPKNITSDISNIVLQEYKRMYEGVCQRFKQDKEQLELKNKKLLEEIENIHKRQKDLSKAKEAIEKKKNSEDAPEQKLQYQAQASRLAGQKQPIITSDVQKVQNAEFLYQIQQLTEANQKLKKQLQDQYDFEAQLKKQISDLKNQEQKNQTEKQRLEIENKKLQEQIKQISRQQSSSISDHKTIQLEETIQKLMKNLDEMKHEKHELENQIEKQQKEYYLLQCNFEESKKKEKEYQKNSQHVKDAHLLRNELNETQRKCSELEQQIKQDEQFLIKSQENYAKDANELKQIIIDKDKQIEQLKLSISGNNNQHQKQIDPIMDMKKQVENLEAKNHQLLSQVNEQEKQIQDKDKQISKLKQQCHELDDKVKDSNYQEQYESVLKEFKELQTQEIMKQEWLDLQKNQLSDIQQEIDSLNHQLSEQQKQNEILVSQLEQQKDESKLSYSQLQDQVSAYDKIVLDKNEEITKLKSEIELHKSVKKDDDFESKYKQLKTEIQKLEAEYKMKLEWAEIQNSEYQEQGEQYEKKIATLVEQLNLQSMGSVDTSISEKQQDKFEEMQDHLKQYELIVNEKNKDITEMKKQINELQQQQHKDDFESKFKNLQTQMQKLEAEHSMKQEWDAIQQDEKQEQIVELEGELEKKDEQIQQLNALNDQLKLQLNEEITKNQTQMKKSFEQFQEIQNSLENQQNIKNALRKSFRNDDQVPEIQDKQSKDEANLINELKKKIKILNEELGEYEDNQLQLQQQIEQLNKQKLNIEGQLQELQKYYEIAYNQVANNAEQEEELRKIIQEKENQIAEFEYQILQQDEQLTQMMELNKGAVVENVNNNEIKAYFEQKISEQDQLIHQLQEQLEERDRSITQDYYQKINEILQKNEELKHFHSEDQEELNKREQLIEELQLQMLSQSQLAGNKDLQERQKCQELLEKVRDDRSDTSNSSLRPRKEVADLMKKIGQMSYQAGAKLATKLDYYTADQEAKQMSGSNSSQNLDKYQ